MVSLGGSSAASRRATATTRTRRRMPGAGRSRSSGAIWGRPPMRDPGEAETGAIESGSADTGAIESGSADDGYRRLFLSHPAAMAIWDPATGRILAANEAAERQYGYGPDEIVGLAVDRIVHPDDLPRLREQVAHLGEGLAAAAPFRHIRRSGEVIEVEMSGHPLDWQGRPARLVMAI